MLMPRRLKLYEPILVLEKSQAGPNPFSGVDMRVRVAGGGHTSQIYAIRQAIAKAIVAYTGKYQDAQTALDLKRVLVAYDRTLLVADPRRMEPKRFGGPGARARYQKSVRQRLVSTFALTLPVPIDARLYRCGGARSSVLHRRASSGMLAGALCLVAGVTVDLHVQRPI